MLLPFYSFRAAWKHYDVVYLDYVVLQIHNWKSKWVVDTDAIGLIVLSILRSIRLSMKSSIRCPMGCPMRISIVRDMGNSLRWTIR